MCSAVDALALDEWWVMDAGLRLGEDGIADDARSCGSFRSPRAQFARRHVLNRWSFRCSKASEGRYETAALRRHSVLGG